MPTILLEGDAIIYNDPTGRAWEVAEIARFSVCPDGGSASTPVESESGRRGHPTGCLLRFRSRAAPAEERLAPGQPADWLGPAQLERAWRSAGAGASSLGGGRARRPARALGRQPRS